MATIQEYLETAKGQIISGASDRAIAICEHVLAHFPKHLEAHCLLAEALRERGEPRAAEDLFLRALSADPERLIARWALSIIYVQRGEREAAVGQLQLALEASPDHGELRKEVVVRLSGQRPKLTAGGLAKIYARGGLFDRAVDEFRVALTRQPVRLDLMVGLAEALWQGGRPREAAEQCRKVIGESPDCLKALLILGMIEGGTEGAAQEVLDKARALDPENRVMEALAASAGITLAKDSPLNPVSVSLPDPEDASIWPEVVASAQGQVAANNGGSRALDAESALADRVGGGETRAPSLPAEELSLEDELAGLGNLVEDAEYERYEAAPEAQPEGTATVAPLAEPPSEDVAAAYDVPHLDELIEEGGVAADPVVATAATEEAQPAETQLYGAPDDEPPNKTVPNWMPEAVNEEIGPTTEVVDDTSWAKWADLLSEEITLDPAAEARLAAALSEVEGSQAAREGDSSNATSATSTPGAVLDPPSRLALAARYRHAAQFDAAVAEYKVVLGSAPHLNEAVTGGLQDVIRSAPNHAQAHRLLGDAYMKAGHFQQAIDEYGRALNIEKASG